jgi:hypothetical protein
MLLMETSMSKQSNAITAALMVGAGTLVFGITTAQADLIDQGITTLDDATGLEWLDLTETVGESYASGDETEYAINAPDWNCSNVFVRLN